MAVIVPKSSKQCREDYQTLLSSLVDAWFYSACRNPAERLYLCGRRGQCSHGTGIWEAVWVKPLRDGEEGTPIRPEPLPMNATKEHVRGILEDWLRREPLYVFAD